MSRVETFLPPSEGEGLDSNDIIVTARLCDRGGAFKIIEFFLENKFMLEVMAEGELQRYRSFMNPEYVRAMMGKRPPPPAQ